MKEEFQPQTDEYIDPKDSDIVFLPITSHDCIYTCKYCLIEKKKRYDGCARCKSGKITPGFGINIWSYNLSFLQI